MKLSLKTRILILACLVLGFFLPAGFQAQAGTSTRSYTINGTKSISVSLPKGTCCVRFKKADANLASFGVYSTQDFTPWSTSKIAGLASSYLTPEKISGSDVSRSFDVETAGTYYLYITTPSHDSYSVVNGSFVKTTTYDTANVTLKIDTYPADTSLKVGKTTYAAVSKYNTSPSYYKIVPSKNGLLSISLSEDYGEKGVRNIALADNAKNLITDVVLSSKLSNIPVKKGKTYYLAVRGSTVLSYNLKIRVTLKAVPAGGSTTKGKAEKLKKGVYKSGLVFSDESRWYKITLSKKGTLKLRFSNVSGLSGGLAATIFNSKGERLCFDNMEFSRSSKTMEVKNEKNKKTLNKGTYYILISSRNSGSGTYRLRCTS